MKRWTAFFAFGMLLLEAHPSSAGAGRVDPFGDPLPAGVQARMGSLRLDCQEPIQSALFAPDGKSLSVMTFASQKQLLVFDVATGKALRRSSLPEGASDYTRTPDNRFLIVRTWHEKRDPSLDAGIRVIKEIQVLDANTEKLIWKTDAKHQFNSMALSSDGKVLAGGSGERFANSNKVFLWETATGKQLLVLKGHSNPVESLAFSPDGKRLVSAGEMDFFSYGSKGKVCVWELPSGKLAKQTSLDGLFWSFSSDGRTLAFWHTGLQKVCL